MRITVPARGGRGLIGLGQTATPAQVQQMIASAAAQYGVPLNVALGVAAHESGFVSTAQNPGSSAAGVYQLISATQQTLGVSDPFDAQQNVDAGVSLLAQYYSQYGNWNDALQAFSDGPGTVGVSPPSAQTLGLIAYVDGYNVPGGVVGAAGAAVAADAGAGAPTAAAVNGGFSLSDVLGIGAGTGAGAGAGVDWRLVGMVVLAAAAVTMLT